MQSNDHPQITIKDFLEELMDHHVTQGVKLAGMGGMDAGVQQRISDITSSIDSAQQLAQFLQINHKIDPNHTLKTICTGILMGMGIVLEVLNERETAVN